MSTRTWVCFECRKAFRREADYSMALSSRQLPLCPECRGECRYLGYKIRVPPRRDKKAWETLRRLLAQAKQGMVDAEAVKTVRRKHEIEREIAKLKSKPDRPGRARLIQELQRKLDGA